MRPEALCVRLAPTAPQFAPSPSVAQPNPVAVDCCRSWNLQNSASKTPSRAGHTLPHDSNPQEKSMKKILMNRATSSSLAVGLFSALLLAGTPQMAHAQLGTGWTQYSPTKKIHLDDE